MMQLASGSTRQKTTSVSLARHAGLLLVSLLLLTGVAPVSAEKLTTPIMQQGGKNDTDMPAHGQSKATVKARFGEPQTIRSPLGDPPITQWYYSDFVVYFEYDHVIHSVAKPKR